MKFLRSLENEAGISMVEALLAAGIVAVTALLVNDLQKSQMKSARVMENRYTKFDVEQSIRTAFMSPAACKCSFTGLTVNPTTLAAVNMTELQVTNDTCGSPRSIVKSGQSVPGSNLKASSIQITNLSLSGTNEVMSDLQIVWNNPPGTLPLKPTFLRNLRLSIGAGNTVTGCGFMPTETSPVGCGSGKICLPGGEQITFHNGPPHYATMGAVSQGIGAGGWLQVMLFIPSGRTTLLKFKEIGGVLRTMPGHPNWKPQLCFSHSANHCNTQNHFGALQFNCGAPVYWSYYNGTSLVDGNSNAQLVAYPLRPPWGTTAAPAGGFPYVSCP